MMSIHSSSSSRCSFFVVFLLLFSIWITKSTEESDYTINKTNHHDDSSSSSASSKEQEPEDHDVHSKSGSKRRRRLPLDHPNFIVLFMDDLGYGDVGYNGHPTVNTPNIDRLAFEGKIFTTWYSGCSVCSGSRAALLTGRQFTRIGVPGVFHMTPKVGLPLEEITIAEQLRDNSDVKYKTGMVGKWHLGQRLAYLPGNQGFDHYFGLPYSVDMGNATISSCNDNEEENDNTDDDNDKQQEQTSSSSSSSSRWDYEMYNEMGVLQGNIPPKPSSDNNNVDDPEDYGAYYLPLIQQEYNETIILEQPVDFTTLATKYSTYATDFITKYQNDPFFLYMPFSHVHCTAPGNNDMPERQYAGCQFRNTTKRGIFGDALAESDWIIGTVIETLTELNLLENTMIFFTSDNGPGLKRGLSGGSTGIFTGRYSVDDGKYWNTGKGTTWEGGIRMPAFVYWHSIIPKYSRSSEIISSLDLFPTISKLANNISLPTDRIIDGYDFSHLILPQKDNENGSPPPSSKHEFLFFYGICHYNDIQLTNYSLAAVRYGAYKAHWCTSSPGGQKHVYTKYPLLFNVEVDPSESIPIAAGNVMPTDPEHKDVMNKIMKAYAFEKSTFHFGELKAEPDGPNEGPGLYGLCCNRSKLCQCNNSDDKDNSIDNAATNPNRIIIPGRILGNNNNNDATSTITSTTTPLSSSSTSSTYGILSVGTKIHHDRYHNVLGINEPSPPRTYIQARLQKQQQKQNYDNQQQQEHQERMNHQHQHRQEEEEMMVVI